MLVRVLVVQNGCRRWGLVEKQEVRNSTFLIVRTLLLKITLCVSCLVCPFVFSLDFLLFDPPSSFEVFRMIVKIGVSPLFLIPSVICSYLMYAKFNLNFSHPMIKNCLSYIHWRSVIFKLPSLLSGFFSEVSILIPLEVFRLVFQFQLFLLFCILFVSWRSFSPVSIVSSPLVADLWRGVKGLDSLYSQVYLPGDSCCSHGLLPPFVLACFPGVTLWRLVTPFDCWRSLFL